MRQAAVCRSVNLDRWRPPLVEAGAPFARFSVYMQVVHALPPLPEPMPAYRILLWIQSEARKIRVRRRLGGMSARNVLAAAESVRFEYVDGLWREKMNLHVWHDQECEWYVAESLEHLGQLYAKQCGNIYEECTGEKLEDNWVQCTDDQVLGIWCTPDGEIGCEDDSGIAPVRRTMREWCERNGPGMLCSSEH